MKSERYNILNAKRLREEVNNIMQERIADYVAMHTEKGIKGVSGYELAARESATYFDERGIDMPNADDWKEFAVYIAAKIEREKGKRPSDDTVRVNYVTRGKAFYRWCNGQQDTQPAAPFEEGQTEASRPPAPDEEAVNTCERKEAETHSGDIAEETDRPSPQNKPVRLSFLLDPERYEMLALLSVLEHKTMTEILTAGADLYIRDHAKQAEILRTAIKTARSK